MVQQKYLLYTNQQKVIWRILKKLDIGVYLHLFEKGDCFTSLCTVFTSRQVIKLISCHHLVL